MIRAATLLLIIATATTAAAQENLLHNGDFEQGTRGLESVLVALGRRIGRDRHRGSSPGDKRATHPIRRAGGLEFSAKQITRRATGRHLPTDRLDPHHG